MGPHIRRQQLLWQLAPRDPGRRAQVIPPRHVARRARDVGRSCEILADCVKTRRRIRTPQH
jgi:hypothetical protein